MTRVGGRLQVSCGRPRPRPRAAALRADAAPARRFSARSCWPSRGAPVRRRAAHLRRQKAASAAHRVPMSEAVLQVPSLRAAADSRRAAAAGRGRVGRRVGGGASAGRRRWQSADQCSSDRCSVSTGGGTRRAAARARRAGSGEYRELLTAGAGRQPVLVRRHRRLIC